MTLNEENPELSTANLLNSSEIELVFENNPMTCKNALHRYTAGKIVLTYKFIESWK